jgi:hypothetical protein
MFAFIVSLESYTCVFVVVVVAVPTRAKRDTSILGRATSFHVFMHQPVGAFTRNDFLPCTEGLAHVYAVNFTL